MTYKKYLLGASALIITLSSATALAVAPNVPSSAEPGRTEKQIAPLAPPHKADGAGTVTSKGVAAAPAGAENVKLTLSSVNIEGMTAYTESQVRPLYANMLGQTVTLVDVYGIAATLTAKYRNDGYILTQVVVPPQTIEGGRVKLRVVEGFAAEVHLEGETNGKLSALQPYVDKIRAAHPFNSKVLERYLLLINDLPGISAKSVLSPSKTPGATDIAIVVSRKPYDVFGQIDNRGTRFMGPLQVTIGTRLNNPFGTYEGINLQYATAPFEHGMQFGSVSVTEPLDHEGTTLNAGASYTYSHPGFTLSSFDVIGSSYANNIGVSHPFIRSRNENLTGNARFDFLDSRRTDNATGFPVEDILSVLRLNGQYQAIDRFAGANTLSAELSHGFDAMGSTGGGNLHTTRPGAENKFYKATAEVSRLQRLTDHFDFFITTTGQLSSDRLYSSEQFGLGGAAYGSAYDPSEITGDDGIAARTELRLNDPFQAPYVMSTQYYGFYDIGKVWDPGNTVASARQQSLASAGLGLRLSINQNVSGSFEAAQPLTHNVATENARHMRFFGALTAKF
jgi:hemolysin activation/secretion protein